MTDHWEKDPKTTLRYRRSDGAVVKYSMGPRKLEWMAYEPDPSEDYLIRRSKSGLGWPRRWSSAKAAMRAVDREYPLRHAVT